MAPSGNHPSLDDVRSITAGLPGVQERTEGRGQLGWYVRRKPFAWEPYPWPSERDDIRRLILEEPCLTVKLPGDDEFRALLECWPEVFAGSGVGWGGPKILVRLQRVDREHLAELVIDAWRTQAPNYLVREWDEANPG